MTLLAQLILAVGGLTMLAVLAIGVGRCACAYQQRYSDEVEAER